MSDEPAASISNVSGGINLNGDATIGGDVVGRDKVTNIRGDYVAGNKIVYDAVLLRATPPAPPAHFTGREDDLAKFTQLLTSGASVAITALHGMGGIGKTSLAQKLAEQLGQGDHEGRPYFPGGVLWWTLGPQADVITALDVWARHADPRADLTALPTAQARAEVVRSMLAQLGQLCVMIDDVWDADSFHILHSAIPSGCALMITTRDSDLAKSLRCRVERIDALSDDEAVELLVNLLGPLNGHAEAACDIAHLTEGLPLALELIAGLADSPADLPSLAQKLRTKPMLDVLKRGTTREQSIEACFTMSYEHLDADLQRRFMGLGVFALAPFDRNAIAAVWADENTDAVDDAIRLLVRRSLLSKDDATQEYKQHALLHDYALKLLHDGTSPSPGAAHHPLPMGAPLKGAGGRGEGSRHAAYYRTFAKEQNWRTVEHFFDQIEWGWQWVQANAPEQIIDYVFAVNDFFSVRGRPFEDIAWQNIALTQARAAKDRKNEGVILNNIAYVYRGLGQKDKALDTYQQALAIRREVDDRSGEGTTLNNVGGIYYTYGQMDEALDTFQQALAIHLEVGNRTMEGTTLNNIGAIYQARGQLDEALDFCKQALIIIREVGDRANEGGELNNIGMIYYARGQLDEALDTYQQALAICREVGDRSGEGTTLNNIGAIYQARGQLEEALDTFQQAIIIHRKVGNRTMEGTTLNNIGAIYQARGQLDEALDFCKQALAICREVGDRSGEGTTLNNIGAIYQARGQLEEALDTFQQALVIHREVGNRSMEGTTFNNIGVIYKARGQLDEALDTFQQAIIIHREVGNRSMEGTTLSNIGAIYQARGELDEALDTYQQALVIHREVGNRSMEGTTLNNIGLIYKARGQLDEALDTFQQALAILREVGDRSGEGTTLNNIGTIYNARGQIEEALDTYQQALAISREVGDRYGEGVTLWNMGDLFERMDRLEEAEDVLQKAVTALRECSSPDADHAQVWLDRVRGKLGQV